jgi:hypothetical protein
MRPDWLQVSQWLDCRPSDSRERSKRSSLGSEAFTVSSDEVRLAAGVSTTRLQTKRLLGVQWKKLIKVKKMKEGTWTDVKPTVKTPSSQDMGLFEGDPTCRFCGLETETAHHIICRCEALACQRYKFFGKLFVEPKDKSMALVKHLCLFVRGTGLMNQC